MTTSMSFRRMKSMKVGRTGGLAVVAAAGLLLAACGTSAGYSSSSAAPPTGDAQRAVMPTASPPSAPPVTIALGASPLGQIAVDAAGHTLYRFDKDIPGSGASACEGACAAAWPPALLNGQPTAGPGLTGSLGVVTRADGETQISLDGHPLYRYAGDQNPGDTTGDGIGGIWHAETVAKSAAAASVGSTGSNGY